MTKFRFPGRATKNATHRVRVPGIKQGTDEAAITAEKIFLVYQSWQHLFGSFSDEDFAGFSKLEAQQAATLAINTALNNELECNAFVDRFPHLNKAQGKLSRRVASESSSKSPSKYCIPSKTNGSRYLVPNKKVCPEMFDIETENSTHKNYLPKFDSNKRSKSEKRLCKSTNLSDKKLKHSSDSSPKNSSIILKPSTLKLESFNSGYTLGSSWSSTTTSTVKPTSLPHAKSCIICEQMTAHPDVQCDWCRSFMEKMTSKSTQKLICLRGRGICRVTQTDVKTRCHACWLACCLTKLPVAHKTLARLKKCLPTSLQYQIGTGIPVKKDPLRGWSDNITNQTQMAARALMKKATKTVNNKNKVADLTETSRKKHKMKEKPKRQKSHLKGPRIKHVCRRACVVLGQPLATFPVSPDSKSLDGLKDKSHKDAGAKLDKKLAKISAEVGPPAPMLLSPDLMGLPVPPPNKLDPPPGWICLDYEPPEGSSVPVISSAGGLSDLPLALCLMCGSAGKDELLFCAMCCEPYHVYCLEVTPQLNKMWICERCELCCECNNPTLHHNDVIRCHKCAAPYHKHCLTIKPSQRPWECPACNVCRSCGCSSNNMRHVGNTAFCPPCYKLRLKGNFCPLCQQCYQDDDYDTKMVECAECLSWVHARCERISDEKYQILSHLPDSVEFHCQNCSSQSPAVWQVAVDNEIRNGVVSILQNLAKYTSIKVTPHKIDKTAELEPWTTPDNKTVKTSQSPFKTIEDRTLLAGSPRSANQVLGGKLLVQPNSAKKSSEIPYRTLNEVRVSKSITGKILVSPKSSEKPSKNPDDPVTKDTREIAATSTNSSQSPNQLQNSTKTTSEKQVAVVENTSQSNPSLIQNCSKPNENISEMKVPEPNEKLKAEFIRCGAVNENNKKHPKIEAAKIKLDFSEENMKFPRLVVRLTDYAKHKPKATQTLKLKQICDAYNIKECSVHLRKCNSQLDLTKVQSKTSSQSTDTRNETNSDKTNDSNIETSSNNNEIKNNNSETKSTSTDTNNSDTEIKIASNESKSKNVEITFKTIEAKSTNYEKQSTSNEKEVTLTEENGQLKETTEDILQNPVLKTPDKNANYDIKILKASSSTKNVTEHVPLIKTENISPSKEEVKLFEKKPRLNSFESPKPKFNDGQNLDVKQLALALRKANFGFYQSLIAFDIEFQNEILKSKCSELKDQYLKLVSETFPWYKPGQEQITEDDALPKIELDTRDKIYSAKVDPDKSWSQLYLPAFGDDRSCALCKGSGDRDGAGGERMLHTSLAPPHDWVHANCALWSSEVWEDREGLLHSLAPGAITRANRTKCALCGNKGASVGCCHSGSCPNSYHWPCALSLLVSRDGSRVGLDLADLSLFCPDHSEEHLPEEEEPEYNFTLARKLRVEPPRNKKRFADPEKIQVAIGSLRVEHVGVVNSPLCHDEARDVLVPDGYVARRLFWSTKEPWRIVEYLMLTELEPEDTADEGVSRDINLTVEHGTHGAPQEVMEKNLRVLRHIQQQEIDLARDSDLNAKESADDLLLPPDLKETIFQDLNSELLDGISMQDIFTKLLSEDAIKEEVLSDTEEVSSFNPVKEVVDSLVDQVCLMEYEPKSRKRNVRSPMSDSLVELPYQKKTCKSNLEYFSLKTIRIPQVDGADDSSPSDSDSKSDSPPSQISVVDFIIRPYSEVSDTQSNVTDYLRVKTIPQVDGADDSSSDSESLSKSDEVKVEVETSLTRKIKERSLAASEPCNEGPVRCESCKRTYRTKTSYDKHLSCCTEVSSDSSDESTESPTTSRMTTTTSKYGTVVLKTKLVLMQSPEKNTQKRKAAKLVRKTVKLAAKPTPLPDTTTPCTPVHNIEPPQQFSPNVVYQEPMMNPIFITPQASNTVYYINVTPSKQQSYLVVNNAESPGHVMYVQAPEQEHNPIILQPSSPYVTLNPSYTSQQVSPAASFCHNAFLPALNSYNPNLAEQQSLAAGGIFLNPGISPQTFTLNQATPQPAFVSQATGQQTFASQTSGQQAFVNQSSSQQAFVSQNAGQQNFVSQNSGQQTFVSQAPPRQQSYVSQPPGQQSFVTQPPGQQTVLNQTTGQLNQPARQQTFVSQSPGQQAFVNQTSGQQQTFVNQASGRQTLVSQATGQQTFVNQSTGQQTFVNHVSGQQAFITATGQPVSLNISPPEAPAVQIVSASKETTFITHRSETPCCVQDTGHSFITQRSETPCCIPDNSILLNSGLLTNPVEQLLQVASNCATIQPLGTPNCLTTPNYSGTPNCVSAPNCSGTSNYNFQNQELSIISSNISSPQQQLVRNSASIITQHQQLVRNAASITSQQQQLQQQQQLVRNAASMTSQQLIRSNLTSSHPPTTGSHHMTYTQPLIHHHMASSLQNQHNNLQQQQQLHHHIHQAPVLHQQPTTNLQNQLQFYTTPNSTAVTTVSQNVPTQVPNFYPSPMQQQQQQQQFTPANFSYMQRSQHVQNMMKQKHPGLIHIGSYKKPTNKVSATQNLLIRPPVATATRLYVQQSTTTKTTTTTSVKPIASSPTTAMESKVVKITASASVGTQTTLRCATPSSIKKEPLEYEDKTGIQFKIHSSDGFTTVAHNVSQVWHNIFEAVQTARKAYNLAPLPYNPFSLSGQHMSGLSQDPMKYLIEQLPGSNKCSEYTPKFHSSSHKDKTKTKLKEPKINPTGCARTEMFKTRNPYDMFGWLASAHRKPPPISLAQVEPSSRRASNSLPMAMRFRQLKSKVKVKVGVFRSHIHGRGLFCLRELEQAEMVIEYAGEVIRSGLTDKREKIYESRGIGCYMFRVDDNIVVDATMKGNAARFINHSCEPNCYSRVVDVLGKKHILIFALRRILPGEELTYDYKFPFEDDKIPCTCSSRKCRKYLN